MVFSPVHFIAALVRWASFILGTLFNGILIYLVLFYTPKSMQIYSKILLQTCVMDIILLTVTLLFQPFSFTTELGIEEAISGGLISFHGAENRGLALASYVLWIFLIYVSMFGYVAQFIYRYLTLNWDKHLSSWSYFALYGTSLLFPLAYCILLVPTHLPPEDHAIMDSQMVAEILGLNLTTDKITLSGYATGDLLGNLDFYYIITFCTLAYVIMCILGWLMHRFLRNRSKLGAPSSSMNQKTIELNKQITRNLLIQATMPFLIYLSMIFFLSILLFKIDVSNWWWLQYMNLMIHIPMYLPSAINPLVSIAIIRYYRRAFVANIDHLVYTVRRRACYCCYVSLAEDEQNHHQRLFFKSGSTIIVSKNPKNTTHPTTGMVTKIDG